MTVELQTSPARAKAGLRPEPSMGIQTPAVNRGGNSSGSPKASSLPITIPNSLQKKTRRKQEDIRPRIGSVAEHPLFMDKENDLIFAFTGPFEEACEYKQLQEDKAYDAELKRRTQECLRLLENAQSLDKELSEVVESILVSLPHDQHRKHSLERLARALQSLGYNATIHGNNAASGAPATLFATHHAHIVVQVPAAAAGSTRAVVVDPSFKAQFTLARPTEEYGQLLSLLPSVFVGGKAALKDLVEFICNRAVESFQSSNLNLPPWRGLDCMLSKWSLLELAAQATATYGCRQGPARWQHNNFGNRIKC